MDSEDFAALDFLVGAIADVGVGVGGVGGLDAGLLASAGDRYTERRARQLP